MGTAADTIHLPKWARDSSCVFSLNLLSDLVYYSFVFFVLAVISKN